MLARKEGREKKKGTEKMQEDPAGQEVQVYPRLCHSSFLILNAALSQNNMELCQGVLGWISGESFSSRDLLSTGTSFPGK